jgi:hypothetical protein
MAKFTKDEMLDELRTIFLFEADHVLLSSGADKAAAFVGFPVGEGNEYLNEPPSRVDLGLFSNIVGSFDRGYEFAFNRSRMNTLGEEEIQDLLVFMEGTPRAGGVSSGGEMHRFMTPDGFCRIVADTAQARLKLERSSDETFSPRELALLANMSEGAVRMAMSDKGDHALRAVPGAKPIAVELAEAKRWLFGRRGFVPFPEQLVDDRFLTRAIRDAQTAEAFGRLIHQAIGFQSASELAQERGLPAAELKAWLEGLYTFDLDRAREVAEALKMDVPLFVGKALELSLRRSGVGK